MGSARTGAILAGLRRPGARALRRVPTALLLIALLLSDVGALPAAAVQGLAGGLPPVTAEPIRPGAAEAPEREGDMARTSWIPPVATASSDGAATVPVPPDRQNGRVQAAGSSPARPALFGTQPLSRGATPHERQAPLATDGEPMAATSPLERRLRQWPAWKLPAPLARPGRQAPGWPAWFSGEWQVESVAQPADAAEPVKPGPPWRARFRPDGRGGAVADRAFNACSVGRSLLGQRLLSVQDDPDNPQRQLARLAGAELLETTLIGQRGETPAPDRFLNDELSLQVLHGPGEPRVSRIETLGQWRLLADGSIDGEQWQARYDSPAQGLAAPARSSEHWRLRLVPVPPGSDRAIGITAPAGDCR